MGERTAFFYGTLMVPQVLQRVTGLHSISHLKITPAILPNHSRHHVRGVDYPGIILHEGSTVRGTYVTGLTDRDVGRLDLFEGSQYKRQRVLVKLLTSGGEGSTAEVAEAETYIFKDKDDLLEKEWDYEEFKREKMDRWVGTSDEYDDLEDDDDDDDEDDEEEEEEKGEDLPPPGSTEEKKILESAV